MWTDESVFYHIYPIGYCNAPERNDFVSNPENRLNKVCEWIEHIKRLHCNAIYFGPIFESTAHGYDTADFFKIDRRLGTNDDFKKIANQLHSSQIKIVLDGVFNHVGRHFWAFKDVQEKKQSSQYCSWFNLSFDNNNHYNDGFSYEGWEGCYDLVKLNLYNQDVKKHIFHAIKSWVEDYDIDGLRLDVAYCLDKQFLQELREYCKNLKQDFWLMGETLHGDYNQWMNDKMLDSVTNYECYKGLFSSFNSKNMFEIAHSLNRQFSDENWSIYKGKHLFTFVDNHDVSRITSLLEDERNLKLIYTLLYTMPGIPAIYYGSEWGIQGKKENGDSALRPNLIIRENTDLTDHISRLGRIKRNYKSLQYGSYKQLQLTNEAYAFERSLNGETLITTINIGDTPFLFQCKNSEINVPPHSSHIFKDGECILYS